MTRQFLYKPLIVFALAFIVFTVNFRWYFSGDSCSTSLLPFSLIVDRSITLDRFYDADEGGQLPYWCFVSRGHVYSSYPIALPILITPLYVPAVCAVQLLGLPLNEAINFKVVGLMEKYVAALIAALSAAMLFALLRKMVAVKTAFFLSLLYAFGTETWSISSQNLWQHGASTLMIVTCLLYIKLVFENRTMLNTAMAGLFAALSVAVRPTNIVFLMACGCYLIVSKLGKRYILCFSIFPLVIGLMICCYNYYVFGDIRGFYTHEFNNSVLQGLAGLLISPNRGLFVYSPVFLFVIPGVIMWFRQGRSFCPQVYAISLAFVVLHLLLISKWFAWYGGWCYGPRLLTDIVPCLMILLIPGLNVIKRIKPLKMLFACIIAASIAVQAVGAFCYDLTCCWDGKPVSVCADPSRVWDLSDNQLIWTIKNYLDMLE